MVADLLERADADRLFHALADGTRRDILRRTLQGEHSVSTLAQGYEMSFAAVQKHVAVLESAHLVTKRKRGREQLVRADVETLRRASALLDQLESLWRDRLYRFGEVLADQMNADADPHPSTTTRESENDR